MIYYVFVHNVGIHSTGILLEKMEAKQGCCNSTSSTTLIKVYRNAPFLTMCVSGKKELQISLVTHSYIKLLLFRYPSCQ